jgi:hypothetical protein
MERPQLVYFAKPVGLEGPIKIGCTYQPQERIIALSVWSPFPIELLVAIPGSFKLERNLHECFADRHSHREWFNPSEKLLAGIEALKAGRPVEEAFDLTARLHGITKKRGAATWRPAVRLKMSWFHRLRKAQQIATDIRRARMLLPRDVDQLLNDLTRGNAYPLTPEQEARLNEVVSHPERHMITLEERYPAKAAA